MRWITLTAIAMAACGDGHSYVVVRVSNEGAALIVQSLDVIATNAGMSGTTTITSGAPFTIPPAQSFSLQVDGRVGDLEVDLTAVGSDGPVAHAADKITIVPGGTAHLELSLSTDNDGGVLSCSNHQHDGDESDVDCGGSCPTRCGEGQGCGSNNDCESSYCNTFKHACAPARCADKVHDGDETDIDCGGSTCMPCVTDHACVHGTDCVTENCVVGLCAPASGPPNWLPVQFQGLQTASIAGAVAPNGKVILVTRLDTQAGGFLSAPIKEYDPETNTIADVSALAHTRADVGVAFLADGRLCVLGGQYNGADQNFAETILGTNLGSLPNLMNARSALAAARGNDLRVYAIGGTASTGLAEAYSLITNTWTGAGFVTGRSFLSATTAADGTIYAIGGRAAGSTTLKTTESYQGDTSNWKKLADLNTQRYYHVSTEGSDHRIYAIGGNDGTNLLASVEAYSPTSKRWVETAALQLPRWVFVGVTLPDGRMMVIGGGNPGVLADKVEFYGPAISVSPSSGQPGAGAAITGGNLGAHAKVSVHFDDPGASVIGTGNTDDIGALTAPLSLIIPTAATTGAHMLTVVDDHSEYPVRVSFSVMP